MDGIQLIHLSDITLAPWKWFIHICSKPEYNEVTWWLVLEPHPLSCFMSHCVFQYEASDLRFLIVWFYDVDRDHETWSIIHRNIHQLISPASDGFQMKIHLYIERNSRISGLGADMVIRSFHTFNDHLFVTFNKSIKNLEKKKERHCLEVSFI